MNLLHALVSSIRQLLNRVRPGLGDRFCELLAAVPDRLRHPTRRDVLRALAVPPALLVLYTLVLIPFTPSISDIRKAGSEQPAQILSADGRKLTEFKQSNRQWVELAEISPNVVKALIATEDHRFYDHFGLDWRRTASAMYYTLQGDRQGGSTLTQQLARNLYPEEIGRAASLTRKLKEAITALKIEAVYSKDEILETYLNTVPFLYNAFGIEMAARTYFDTSADDLDVLQSATLVGMLKGQQLLQSGAQPRTRLATAQHRAGADGQARPARRGEVRVPEAAAAACRIRAPKRATGTGAALRAAAAQVADRLGRPQRLQHLQRWTRRPHNARLQAASPGEPSRCAPGLPAPAPRQRRVESQFRMDTRQSAGRIFHARRTGIPGRNRRRRGARTGDQAARRRHRLHARTAPAEDDDPGRLPRARPAERTDQSLGRQPRLQGRRFRPCSAGAPATGLDLQALCLRRSLPPGNEPRGHARR